MLELYGTPRSRAARGLWALEEVEADYIFKPVDLMAGEHRSPEYLAVNPLGKVPALKDGDFVLWESSAICTYIGERFPAYGLVPSDKEGRALCNQWSSFVTTELEQPLWTIAKHTFALPEKMRVDAIRPVAAKEFDRPLDVLAGALEGDRTTLVGDRFTVADILAAHTLSWAGVARIPLKHDVVKHYMRTNLARPAHQRVVEKYFPPSTSPGSTPASSAT